MMFSSTSAVAPKDIEVPQCPTDGISQVCFSPVANFLAASSWDNQVRCWEVQTNGKVTPKMAFSHASPVLCCCWHSDGSKLFSAGCDNIAKMMDLNTGQSTQVAQHAGPIKACQFVAGSNYQALLTGSWDKSLKYWDLRAHSPVASVALPDRCYAMDAKHPLLVVACGGTDRMVNVFSLENPTQLYKQFSSPLKFQTRCVSCFSSKDGFAMGSVEGRVQIHYIDERANPTFSFKCHREQTGQAVAVYSVNDISFHPTYGTFSTAGSDGTFNFWDKDSKQRLKMYHNVTVPIVSTCFNQNGSIFAYACCYDWSKGHEYSKPDQKSAIFLHGVIDQEVKPKPKQK